MNTAQFARVYKVRAVENTHLARDNAEMKQREMDIIEQIRAMEAMLAHKTGAPPIVEALRPVRRPPKIKLMRMVDVQRG